MTIHLSKGEENVVRIVVCIFSSLCVRRVGQMRDGSAEMKKYRTTYTMRIAVSASSSHLPINHWWNELLEMPHRSRHVRLFDIVFRICFMLNRTARAGFADRKLDLHFRASLYHPKLGWMSSGQWFASNAGPMDSCAETRAQKGCTT